MGLTFLELPAEVLLQVIAQLDCADVLSLFLVPGFASVVQNCSTVITPEGKHPQIFTQIPSSQNINAAEIAFIEVEELKSTDLSYFHHILNRSRKIKFITTLAPLRLFAETLTRVMFCSPHPLMFRIDTIMSPIEALVFGYLEGAPFHNWQLYLPNQKQFGITKNMGPSLFKAPNLESLIVHNPTLQSKIPKFDFPKLQNLLLVASNETPKIVSFLDHIECSKIPTKALAVKPQDLATQHYSLELSNHSFEALEDVCTLNGFGLLRDLQFPKLKELQLAMYWRSRANQLSPPTIENVNLPRLESLHIKFHLGLFPQVNNLHIPPSCVVDISDNTGLRALHLGFEEPETYLPDMTSLSGIQELHIRGGISLLPYIPSSLMRLRLYVDEQNPKTLSLNTATQSELPRLEKLSIDNSQLKLSRVALINAPNLTELRLCGLSNRTRTIYEICDHFPNLKRLNFETHLIKESDKRPRDNKNTTFKNLDQLVIWTKVAEFNNLTQLISRFEFPVLSSLKVTFHSLRKTAFPNLEVSFASIPTLKKLNMGLLFPRDTNLKIADIVNLETLKLPYEINTIELDDTPQLRTLSIDNRKVHFEKVSNVTHLVQKEMDKWVNLSKKRKREEQRCWKVIPTPFTEPTFDWSWDNSSGS